MWMKLDMTIYNFIHRKNYIGIIFRTEFFTAELIDSQSESKHSQLKHLKWQTRYKQNVRTPVVMDTNKVIIIVMACGVNGPLAC